MSDIRQDFNKYRDSIFELDDSFKNTYLYNKSGDLGIISIIDEYNKFLFSPEFYQDLIWKLYYILTHKKKFTLVYIPIELKIKIDNFILYNLSAIKEEMIMPENTHNHFLGISLAKLIASYYNIRYLKYSWWYIYENYISNIIFNDIFPLFEYEILSINSEYIG